MNNLFDTITAVTAETNSSFSAVIPNLQIALDSTSLGALKTCPRYYEYNIIEGWTPSTGTGSGTENPHIKFGYLFHGATEVYDHCRADGYTHDHAVRDAIEYAIHAAWDKENNRPWLSTEPTKTLKTLLRTLVWYLDKFEHDPLETFILPTGKPATELSFSFSLSEIMQDKTNDYIAPSGESYILCGHLDRVATWNGDTYIIDKKTTKTALSEQYFANYNPDNQMTLYTIAGQVVLHKDIEGVIVDATQVQVTSSRFQRRPIQRSQAQLEEWLVDLKFYLRMLEAYARLNYWPQNDKACGLFGGCKFRPICSADPSVRQELLEAFYTKRTWDPMQPR